MTHALNVAVHVTAGTLALALGLVPLLSSKGSRLHRAFGWIFVAAGSVTLACAVIGVMFFPQPGPLVMATGAISRQSGFWSAPVRKRLWWRRRMSSGSARRATMWW